MSYSEALGAQIAAAREFKTHGREYVQSVGESVALLTMVAHGLSHGDPYYWSPTICRTVERIASTLPDSFRLTFEDLPSQEGFFFFAAPVLVFVTDIVRFPDVYDTQSRQIDAVSWGRVASEDGRSGICLCAYTRDTAGDLIPYNITSVWPPASLRDAVDHWSNNNDQGWPIVEYCAQLARLFGTCLSFLRDRIFVTSARLSQVSYRRRLERAGFHHEPLIRVIELRRKQSRAEAHADSEPVEWSHQWIVSGHWRQQFYPSLNTHQPRWIMPYVKGPESKPLKPPRAKVFAVVR